MKCVKIICTYFGHRRRIHNTPQDILNFIKNSIRNEIDMENGIETDVIVVINDVSEVRSVELDEFNNISTKNGKIIIENRRNYKGSFGAYYEMFDKYQNEYDYWFFCEDDVLIYKQNYLIDFINHFESDDTIGFVSLAPLSHSEPLHSGGGCGLTSKETFIKVNTIEYIKSYISGNDTNTSSYDNLIPLEINFTNIFVRNGLKLSNHPNYSPLCDNYGNHMGQSNHATKEMKELEFIYRVGN